MATLKDHQQAMVDLLASGSGIPASASRLAHAMHDLIEVMASDRVEGKAARLVDQLLSDESNYGVNNLLLKVGATTPGLNDKALAGDLEACRPKVTPAERRVKELENTVNQLRASNAKLKEERDSYKTIAETHAGWIRKLEGTEQAGCRKDDTQVCEHEWSHSLGQFFSTCTKCRAIS